MHPLVSRKFPKKTSISLLTGCLLWLSNGAALETDKDQPLQWTADGNMVMRNEGDTRITDINRNVRIVQGSLVITGDTAVFEHDLDSGDLLKVTIEGSPAEYQQELDDNGGAVLGESQTIYYYASGEIIIEFVADAVFKQRGDNIACAEIKHFPDSGRTEYTGPCQAVLTQQSD